MNASPGVVVGPLAVFDLDGTLLTRDSFLPFLVSYACRRLRYRLLLSLPLPLAMYACRLTSDRRAKERLLVSFFGGEEMAAIKEHASWFCEHWVKPRVRPALAERLHYHQAAGHRVILLSASPDLYVPAIGRALGITEVVSTRVAVAGSRCAGHIVGDNCKGENKVEALRCYLGGNAPPGSFAYGDSRSDLPVLRWVTSGYLVRRGRLVEVK